MTFCKILGSNFSGRIFDAVFPEPVKNEVYVLKN